LRRSDLVHVHSLFTNPVHVTLREALIADRPVVLRPCGQLHPYSLRRSRWVKRAYLALWGRMIRRACSAWHYTSAQEAAASWASDGSHFVLPNGIETAEFAVNRLAAREEAWKRWRELHRRPYVVFLGRLHSKKRLDVLLGAFLSRVPEPHRLVVAGPDEEGLWPRLARRFLSDPDTARRVLYIGAVDGRDKATLLAGAELFALPSEHENFGIAALEALAAGTPVLLSPHVDLAQEVEGAGFGFTAPVEATAWGRRLADLLACPERLQALAAPTRAWACKHFSWGRIADELLHRYHCVLRARPEYAERTADGRLTSGELPSLHPERGSQPAPLSGQPPLV
jgi:glycosyltransferase involved in cell wall biosynthesis